MRVLAVGNVYAAYQMEGIYPFEVFTHKRGHKLIGSSRLPEAVYLYATKGRCRIFPSLLRALEEKKPVASLTVHRQCIIGIVWLEEVSTQQAAIIAPGIPLLDRASQILHITRRVVWPAPFKLVSSERFDKWVKVDARLQTDLTLHSERMTLFGKRKSYDEVCAADLPKVDGLISVSEEEQDEEEVPLEDEPEGDEVPEVDEQEEGEVPEVDAQEEDEVPEEEFEVLEDQGGEGLERHDRSTRSYDFFCPGLNLRSEPDIMSFHGKVPRHTP